MEALHTLIKDGHTKEAAAHIIDRIDVTDPTEILNALQFCATISSTMLAQLTPDARVIARKLLSNTVDKSIEQIDLLAAS